jgi:hypothetical protein
MLTAQWPGNEILLAQKTDHWKDLEDNTDECYIHHTYLIMEALLAASGPLGPVLNKITALGSSPWRARRQYGSTAVRLVVDTFLGVFQSLNFCVLHPHYLCIEMAPEVAIT